MKEPKATQHPEDVLLRHVKTVHNLGSVVDAMQEYSDQQNAEFREEVERKRVSLVAMFATEKALKERVKRLEGALTATLNVARACASGRFVDILDKAEKTLKK